MKCAHLCCREGKTKLSSKEKVAVSQKAIERSRLSANESFQRLQNRGNPQELEQPSTPKATQMKTTPAPPLRDPITNSPQRASIPLKLTKPAVMSDPIELTSDDPLPSTGIIAQARQIALPDPADEFDDIDAWDACMLQAQTDLGVHSTFTPASEVYKTASKHPREPSLGQSAEQPTIEAVKRARTLSWRLDPVLKDSHVVLTRKDTSKPTHADLRKDLAWLGDCFEIVDSLENAVEEPAQITEADPPIVLSSIFPNKDYYRHTGTVPSISMSSGPKPGEQQTAPSMTDDDVTITGDEPRHSTADTFANLFQMAKLEW